MLKDGKVGLPYIGLNRNVLFGHRLIESML